jgi:tetratricopeptide (TPR) repeat protein
MRSTPDNIKNEFLEMSLEALRESYGSLLELVKHDKNNPVLMQMEREILPLIIKKNLEAQKQHLATQEQATSSSSSSSVAQPSEQDEARCRHLLKQVLIKGNKGDHKGVIADMTEVIKIHPIYMAYRNRGIANMYLGNLGEAIADSTNAIKLNSEDFEAYNTRGVALMKKGNIKEAIANFTQALALKPNDFIKFSAYANLGYAKEFLKDYSGALKDLEKSQELGNKSSKLLSAIERCQQRLISLATSSSSSSSSQAVAVLPAINPQPLSSTAIATAPIENLAIEVLPAPQEMTIVGSLEKMQNSEEQDKISR